MTKATELFRRCRVLIRELASMRSGSGPLRVEFATQPEHELPRSTNPAARSVVSVVLNHLGAA